MDAAEKKAELQRQALALFDAIEPLLIGKSPIVCVNALTCLLAGVTDCLSTGNKETVVQHVRTVVFSDPPHIITITH